jgi:asparagine synthase (glutamine-hydrolysing)
MCGIIGFIDPGLGSSEAYQLLDDMLLKTHHRGPDHTGRFHQEEVHLGHNRLSIIDLSEEANQPFERDSLVMIYNGEVYNYIELKAELQGLGQVFKTNSDTEVILAAYQEWGADCVKRFVGMWSFLILDRRDKSLFASRDRFGIKPFHYIHGGEAFYFASEMKALRLCRNFTATVNERQVAIGLQLGRLQDGEETYFKEIKNLPAAHNLSFKNGKLRIWKYWEIERFSSNSASFDEKKSHFRSLFFDSVRIHLRSDVELGACLSGGLDSSAIASTVSHLFPDQKLNTFSIYYPFEGFDEREWIHKVVEKYPNLNPTYFSPSEEDLLEHFDRFFYHQDIPVAGSSPFSQYFLMRLAKEQGVTVTLDGQGADEFLGGYMHSFYPLIADQVSRLNFGKALGTFRGHAGLREFNAKQQLNVLIKSAASFILSEDRLMQTQFEKGFPFLSNEQFQVKEGKNNHAKSRFDNFLHSQTFSASLPNLLHYEDRNSMAFSIESRVPFLDHRLVEAGLALLPENKINKGVTKFMLRESMKGIIPNAIYERQDKKAFNTPGEVRWLRGPMADLLELNEKTLSFLNSEKTSKVLDEFKKGNDKHSKLVWRLAMLNRWLKEL